jgi:hypothetical protein
MPLVESELTIPAFEGAKRVHALDLAATVFCMWSHVVGYKFIEATEENTVSIFRVEE